MARPVILVIEDNPVTLKMARVALQAAGYEVLEAADGKTALELAGVRSPDLIIQDLRLPDMDGFDLVRRLRGLPNGGEIPILAWSGIVPRIEEAQVAASGFTDFLVKPVDPSMLVQTVQAYLEAAGPSRSSSGAGRRVLICDDDPVQLKLLRIRIEHLGFKVATAPDGLAALNLLKAAVPDALVSDILMPGLDGFRLCLAVRKELGLTRLPVILASSTYIEEPDRLLAGNVGATAYVMRTPDFQEVLEALMKSLRSAPPPARPALEGLVEKEYSHRVIRQLERQAATNTSLTQRCAFLATELSILAGISEAVMRSAQSEEMFRESLAYCTDLVGISVGALYLFGEDGALRLAAAAGVPEAAANLSPLLKQERFLNAIYSGEPVILATEGRPEGWDQAMLKALQATSVVVLPLVQRNGSRIGAILLGSSTKNLTEQELHSFAQTVAGQISLGISLTKAFANLAASEQRYRDLFASSVDGILVSDIETRKFRSANPAICKILGYTEAELTALGVEDIHPADALPRVLSEFEAVARKEKTAVLNIPYLRKDGTIVQTDVSANMLTIDGRAYLVGMVRDITERHRLERELLQSQKMEAIGRLAGGVAHDFNNLLTAIEGYTGFLLKSLPVVDKRRADAVEILKAAESAAELTKQLLVFSRRQISKPRILDCNTAVRDMEKMLKRLIGENIEMTVDLAEGKCRIKADAGQIEQVIMNLIVNARDSMPRGGAVTIKTENAELDEKYSRLHMEVRPGPYVMISVTDTGSGIPPEVLPHIFEPFFTTKAAGKGTGLGLATVYGIVKQNGGNIHVYSEPGLGTTFKIYLPCAMAEVETAAATARPVTLKGTETILVVEDEDTVRALARRILSESGYTVLEARDPGEGAALCESSPGKISLILTDTIMPGMSGYEFYDKISKRWPGIKVIFMSGYTSPELSYAHPEDEKLPFIQKPFTADGLAEKVREVLDAPAEAKV